MQRLEVVLAVVLEVVEILRFLKSGGWLRLADSVLRILYENKESV